MLLRELTSGRADFRESHRVWEIVQGWGAGGKPWRLRRTGAPVYHEPVFYVLYFHALFY